jgi:hypothetical protein
MVFTPKSGSEQRTKVYDFTGASVAQTQYNTDEVSQDSPMPRSSTPWSAITRSTCRQRILS